MTDEVYEAEERNIEKLLSHCDLKDITYFRFQYLAPEFLEQIEKFADPCKKGDEPSQMINQGSKFSKILNDGWTVETRDGRNSAQWEHTIAVTKDGSEILTKRNEEFQ